VVDVVGCTAYISSVSGLGARLTGLQSISRTEVTLNSGRELMAGSSDSEHA